MTRQQMLLSVIGSFLIILLVIGCGGASPHPGATFSGPMEISSSGMGSNVTADGGEIEFTVTEDGAGIDSTIYNLINAVCSNDEKTRVVEGAWSKGVQSFPPPPIENGSFEIVASDGVIIKGNFNSATEANGTIEISTEEGQLVCDFGTWNWSAIVK